MDTSKIEKILNDFSKTIKSTIKSSTTTNENIGKITATDDKNFEDDVRKVLKEHFNLTPHENIMLTSNKEFVFYKMDLFKYDSKEHITSEYFNKDSPYFCIVRKEKAKPNEILKKAGTTKDIEEYFIIKNDDLSTLYYKNAIDNKEDTARGIEESNYTSGEATKFFFIQDDEKNSKDLNEIFVDTIKFNLLSSQTVSLIGENNNIPEDILKNCYAKGQLFSKGKIPHMLSFVKYNECSGIEGKFHYPMKPYYIKLTSMKGQIDAAFRSHSEIKMVDFQCKTIYSNFEIIPENSTILFEFKNGKGGERKVITQAFKYQINADYILKKEKFYHIIIIESKELGNALDKYIKENNSQIKSLNNFAVLCLDSTNNICGKKLQSNSKAPNKKKKKSNKDSKVSATIEKRIGNIENRMGTMEDRMGTMEDRMGTMEDRMGNMERDIDFIKQTLSKLAKSIEEIKNNKNNSKEYKNDNIEESAENKEK